MSVCQQSAGTAPGETGEKRGEERRGEGRREGPTVSLLHPTIRGHHPRQLNTAAAEAQRGAHTTCSRSVGTKEEAPSRNQGFSGVSVDRTGSTYSVVRAKLMFCSGWTLAVGQNECSGNG